MTKIIGFPEKELPRIEKTLLDKINEYCVQPNVDECVHAIAFEGKTLTKQSISYKSLAYFALELSKKLLSIGKDGDRILLSVENPIEFSIAFVAILAAKRIAVPVPPVDSFKTRNTIIQRVQNIYKDCDPCLFITDNNQAWEEAGFPITQLLSSKEIYWKNISPSFSNMPLPTAELNDIAYLQYTSGSTGKPKGCIITHHNIAANVTGIATAGQFMPQDKIVSWLPLYHDMGLIGLLAAIYVGINQYSLTPRKFITNPISWLKAITTYGGTLILGPTFGYHLATQYIHDRQLIGIDLSTVRLAYMGAEPIPTETINQFIARFAPYGFRAQSIYPCYGLAECTLAAAVPQPNQNPTFDYISRRFLTQEKRIVRNNLVDEDILSFVSVGHALPGHEISIYNLDTHTLCSEGELGEIVIKGPSVMRGYFNSHSTVEVLRTGDIGYIFKNQLYVIERIKDIIIIAGQNFYPSDVETNLAELPEFSKSKIFCFASAGNMGTEKLNIVIEMRADPNFSYEKTVNMVQNQVYKFFGISEAQVFVVPRGSLKRTSSGKIMRHANKNLDALHNHKQQSWVTME